jgi:hypothetical protein
MPGGSGPLALPELVFGLEIDANAIARAQGLLDRFLAQRQRRTLAAYTLDIEEFAGFAGQPPALALAQLVAAGPIAGRDRLLDYAVHLRERGRAQATVNRRLGTLRTLLRMAVDLGLVDGTIRVPSENQVRAATEEPPTESPHYLFPLCRHRHNGNYAERRVMPIGAPLELGSGRGGRHNRRPSRKASRLSEAR